MTTRALGQSVTMLRSASISLLMLAISVTAHAQPASAPKAGPGDPRIKEFVYNPDAVVTVQAYLGYEMTIEFDPSERIENVSVGDSLSWQATPNRKATLLFLKPMAKNASTSMTVVTSQRIYSFILNSVEAKRNDPNQLMRLRFVYPKPPAATAAATAPITPPKPEDFNFDYSNKGAKSIWPIRVFDDGQATYFQFDAKREAPAVFFTAPDGKEEMANTRVMGAYTVADVTAEHFTLRYGKTKAEVRNNNWKNRPAAEPAPLPQRRGN